MNRRNRRVSVPALKRVAEGFLVECVDERVNGKLTPGPDTRTPITFHPRGWVIAA